MGSDARDARRALRAARIELRTATADLDRLEGRRPRRSVPRWAVLVVVVAVVLAAVTAVMVQRRVSTTVYPDAEVIAATRALITPVLTPDVADPDAAGRILDDATGSFRDEFAQSGGAYRALVARLGTRTTGTVDGVAIADRRGDAASVLVTAVLVTSRTDAAPQTTDPRRLRLMVAVAPDGGRLKLADVELVP
ncbi:hypothetical protein [Williamsia deligens]|uniref:Mce-associated membrane protein n=1 Tax=Williamsia deligens TaxID=321325 RepID=A0ABW3G1J4_9NOCA|nr:hypothetical protein [Williamsia deligens]MCP2194683.1 Mce-associated membrane protein [Williamsia deligens]